MKIIITGATGMIGKGALLECLKHSAVSKVLSVSRRPAGIEHPKLKELLHEDFSEFDSVKDQLKGYHACFHSMGVSAAGMNEAEYTKLTYDFSLALATTLYRLNPQMTFVYVSGQGTKSSEKGIQMWARVKGKTENELLKLGFDQAFMFRPGVIVPLKGIEASSNLYRFLINNMKWSFGLIKKMAPNSVVDTSQIGLAMINATQNGYEKNIITPKDIIILSSVSSRSDSDRRE